MQLLPVMSTRRRKRPHHRKSRPPELIVFAADLSPSMTDTFRLSSHRVTTRLKALQEAATFFFTQKATASQRTQVCMIGFNRDAHLLLDWTPLRRLDVVIRCITSLCAVNAYTNIAAALKLALDRIAAAGVPISVGPRPKVLLVTDGAGNVDTHLHAPLIRRASSQGVRLHPVAICNRRDDPASYDRDLLMQMAGETHGHFRTAHSLDQLKQALGRVS